MKGMDFMKNMHIPPVLRTSSNVANTVSQQDPKAMVLQVFQELIESPNWIRADYDRLISKDYIQVVDGNILNYDQVLKHLEVFKDTYKSITVVFHDIVVQGNKIATRHTAHAVKKDGSEIEVYVMAIYEVKDGKLFRLDELTQIKKGSQEDADFGSRY